MTLLVLYFHSDNLGDPAIGECTAALIRQAYPQARVLLQDMLDRPPLAGEADLAQWRRECRRNRLRTAAARLGWDKLYTHAQWCLAHNAPGLERVESIPCDGVIFAGGQFFMDGLAPYVSALTAAFACRGIPVFFNACGVGSSVSGAIRRDLAAALTLPEVRLVSCRDDADRVSAWCGRPGYVRAVSDPALMAGQLYHIARDPNAVCLGLGIQFPSSLPEGQVRRFWHRLIARLQQDGVPFRLFTNGSRDDEAYARELLASAHLSTGPELLAPKCATAREFVQMLAGFSALISFRLHSHILACSLDIPTVAIVWDRKVPLFFRQIGHPERCLSPKARPDRVLSALDQARRTGYDRPALEKRSRESAALLLGALEQALPELSREKGGDGL